jgi:MarR family transcriptional regulator, organic hydroperoxide resistance regulator
MLSMLIIVVRMPDLDNWPTPRLLSTAARMVEHSWNERLASLSLTHAGAIALEVLETGGPVVQAQLAVKARVKPQTMSRTLARLEAHGYIARVNEANGRGQQVAISKAGRRALAQAYGLERDLIAGSGIGVEELREQLAAIIRQFGSTD